MRIIITDIHWTCGQDMNEQQTAARAMTLMAEFVPVIGRKEFLALEKWPDGKDTVIVATAEGKRDVQLCVRAARLGATAIFADDGNGKLVEVA